MISVGDTKLTGSGGATSDVADVEGIGSSSGAGLAVVSAAGKNT